MDPVHLVEPLGLGVPGLELVVADRPGRGEPVDVLDLAEVLGPQPVEGCAVHLRGAPDVVVDLGLEGRTVGVVPGVVGDVATGVEHLLRLPVLRLAGQEVPSLEQEDPLAGGRQGVRQRAPSCSGPDHDHVVVVSHG